MSILGQSSTRRANSWLSIWAQDLTASRAPSLVRRRDIEEVAERIDAHGNVLAEVDEDAVQELAAALQERGYESVGICFLWSFVNDAHEAKVAEIKQRLEETGEIE